ncbi:hypothetical protein ACWEFL_03425 [Streptomyces sp. NPDC004838]
MAIFVRTAGTVLVTVLLSYPIWAPDWGLGILGEVAALGIAGALAAVAVFFGLVALYCRALQRTLRLIPPQYRTARPVSVWWMFAIPYNFTEDFFIVRNVAASLAVDARLPGVSVRRWAALGYGWCAFQILSLFPGVPGYVGGGVAIPLWAAHWITTVRVNRALATRPTAVPVVSSIP